MSKFNSSIKYSETEVTEILLKNVLLMIQERGIIDNKNYKKNLKSLHDQIKDELLFTLINNKFKIGIRIVKYKVTSITKVEGINEFLDDETYNLKIVIFKDMNQKTFKQLLTFDNTQAFWERELMMNIIDHDYVSKHIVLSEDERKDFIKSYQITRDKMPKLEIYDPIVRYYNMQIGDIVRIIRNSPSAGKAVYYRVVVPSPVQDLFS
jgi:DNA-directed RNA polymerase subunit H (RpoH/RPB5)